MIKKLITKIVTTNFLSSFCSGLAIGATQTFNEDGSFTVPAGVNQIAIQAWGGGGPGSFSQGGGGGSFCAATIAVVPNNTLSVKVGAGGVASNTQGTPPTPGGPSSVTGTDVVANGGSAGLQPSGDPPSFTGGSGGTVDACIASGATKFVGGEGGKPKEGGGGGGGGSATASADGVKGGDATATVPGAGGNGQGAGGDGGAIGAAGSTGIAPGGGGGGGGSSQTAQVTDGNGARGQVIINYTTQSGNAPIVTTNAASDITKTGATLNGMVDANGATATASFDFGTDSSYGTNIVATPSSVTGTSTVVATKTDLTCATTYHYQITATSSAGTSNGDDKSFTTSECNDAVQANLESPQQNSYESGIGLIRGWACDANLIELQINGGTKRQVAYGTTRSDTQSVCGDSNNGFGFVYNWNSLGNGTHNLKLFIDGQEFANVNFTVATLGEDFLVGASGEYPLNDFPESGNTVTIRWSEPHQNFVIVGYSQ